MIKVYNMKVIKLYLNGLENLMAYFDRVDNKNKSVLFCRVPLLSRIHSPYFQQIIWIGCLAIEPLLSFLVETALLLPYCWKAATTKQKALSDYLYIDNCPLLKKRTIAAGVYDKSVDWIYSFLVDENAKDKSKTIHTYFEYLSMFDVLRAYLLAVLATFLSLRITKFKYLMRNYSAFEYCLTYIYLQKIPRTTTICFCNQMDKWALLFDNSTLNKILFQHGIETPSANWPHKLKNIETVYVLSLPEAECLFKASFERKPSNIYVMNPTINLTAVDTTKYNILIVGFPGYGFFDKESIVVETFSQAPYCVYLKPHPGKEDMTKYKELADAHKNYCKLILDQTFPDVNIVVSYRSTLAVEYQAYNKRVLLYNEYSIDEIIKIIKELQKKA